MFDRFQIYNESTSTISYFILSMVFALTLLCKYLSFPLKSIQLLNIKIGSVQSHQTSVRDHPMSYPDVIYWYVKKNVQAQHSNRNEVHYLTTEMVKNHDSNMFIDLIVKKISKLYKCTVVENQTWWNTITCELKKKQL